MEHITSTWFLLTTLLLSTPAMAQDAATLFREAVIGLANDGLGVQAYQDYINTAAELNYEITNIPGDQLASQIANTLQSRLQTHSSLVQRTRDRIQEAFNRLDGTSLTSINCCNVTSNGNPYDVRFRSQTDTNSMCSLGLSTNSLDAMSSIVLYGMQLNLQQNPSLRWQYFGTENGNMYRYPATVGQSCDKTVYDPRLSQWYKSTISPNAKDVVILIHRSSSMASYLPQAIGAAQLIIDSLNTEDQVAVVAFADQTTVPQDDSCYSRQLSVVNPTTRLQFEQFLNKLSTGGSANYAQAFRLAFALLNTSSSSSTGMTQRDRAIVLITNGVGLNVESQQLNTLSVIADRNKLFRNQVIIFAFTVDDTSSTVMGYLANITKQVTNDQSVAETTQTTPQKIRPSENLRTAMATYFTAFVQKEDNAPVVYTVPYSDSIVGLIMSLCVPVKLRSQLRGVTCVDVTIDTLFSEIQYFQQSSSSYAFLMDGNGRLLIHPLLPQLSSLVVDTPLAELTAIEYDHDDNILRVRQGMLSQTPGSLTFEARTVTPRGDTVRKGVNTAMHQATYYWHPVTSTNFSVCVVIADNNENISVEWNSTTFPYPPVYLMDYEPIDALSPQKCVSSNQVVLRNQASVKLAPQAFSQPSLFRDFSYDDTVHKEWKMFLQGQLKTSAYLKPNIRDAVASTYAAEAIWQARDTSEYAIWRYVGLKEGIFRKTPGNKMATDYDPTLRPWYQEAVAEENSYACYGPYLDASNTGCLLTLAKAILRNGGSSDDPSRIIGVMGIDFTVDYLNGILLSKFSNCSQPNIQCFIIDRSGYVIVHRSFLQIPVSRCQAITLQHITCIEPGVAQDMISKTLLINDHCINYVDNTQLTFWKVQLTSNPQFSGSYDIHSINETNMFVVIKYGQSSSAPCTCYSSPHTCSPSIISSSSMQCQSPCFSSTMYSQVCLGRSNVNSSIPPCYPPPPSLNLTNLTAAQAPYLSSFCPCKGPVNCTATTSTTTATTTTTLSTLNSFSPIDTGTTKTSTVSAIEVFSTVNIGTTTSVHAISLPSSPSSSTVLPSSTSSDMLPLLALLALLIVPVVAILFLRKRKRTPQGTKWTQSEIYQHVRQLFLREKEVDPHEVDPYDTIPVGLDEKKDPSNPTVDVNPGATNSYRMTENNAYGKSVRITKTNETLQSRPGDVNHTINSYDGGMYLNISEATSNSSGTANCDVEHKPPSDVSAIAGQSVLKIPDHGVYLRTINSASPEPVVSPPECRSGSPGVDGRTQLVAVKLPDSGSMFDGQAQLTALEKATWIADDVDLDDNEAENTTSPNENDIYIHAKYESTKNLDNRDVDQKDPNMNNASMNGRADGDLDRNISHAAVKSTEC